MTSNLTMPFALVCPFCRKPDAEGNLPVSMLAPVLGSDGAVIGDQCPRCQTQYPHIEGIPCIPPDLKSFREAQGATLGAHWIHADRESAAVACRIAADLDVGSATYQEVSNLACHAVAHFPAGESGNQAVELKNNRILIDTVMDWLGRTDWPRKTRSPCALDVGCGPGVFLHALAPLFGAGVLGLDVRIGVLRLARRLLTHGEAFLSYRCEGRRFEPVRISTPHAPQSGAIFLVQGDVLAPPLEAEAFPLVAGVSLLDTVSDPLFALGQLDALVAPGGLLLLGTPYSWDARATSPREWWSTMESTGAGTLRTLLAGRHPVLPHLNYEILRQADHVVWSVPGHDRLIFRFFLDIVLARKIDR